MVVTRYNLELGVTGVEPMQKEREYEAPQIKFGGRLSRIVRGGGGDGPDGGTQDGSL